ncbi:hypothetical protein COPCOM_00405 [Coprococcus comes ATCC 27758]|uniref:Uncharacterized protein n=1 Tax=Coprococcus comes ATCC 27758 TaxID=470146 RepID=C0B5I4_9FIRM|nr:hypothetical protein COPCOM_00405 [Coprococcus comes ATCC 27758]
MIHFCFRFFYNRKLHFLLLKGLRQVSKYCHDQFCDKKIK